MVSGAKDQIPVRSLWGGQLGTGEQRWYETSTGEVLRAGAVESHSLPGELGHVHTVNTVSTVMPLQSPSH